MGTNILKEGWRTVEGQKKNENAGMTSQRYCNFMLHAFKKNMYTHSDGRNTTNHITFKVHDVTNNMAPAKELCSH